MTSPTRKTALAAALGLAGSNLLATPALAMTDLVQGYALAANAPPTAQPAPTPPPTEPTAHAEGKCGAEHKQAEGSCGAHHGHDGDKADNQANAPATSAANASGQATTGDADKGMEGKCGEGKCGGSL